MSEEIPIFSPRTFNAKTFQRFKRNRIAALTKHAGGSPSCAQQILIARIVRNEWDLRRLDDRFDTDDDLSAYAMRSRLAMENRLRLDLRELGLKAIAASPPSLTEQLAACAAERSKSLVGATP